MLPEFPKSLRHSQHMVEEDCRDHHYDSRNAEVCEAIGMRSPEEFSTAVGVKYTPEDGTQWGH